MSRGMKGNFLVNVIRKEVYDDSMWLQIAMYVYVTKITLLRRCYGVRFLLNNN